MSGPILIIGATRSTGLQVVSLLRRKSQRIRVLARRPGVARQHLSDDVEIVAGDLTNSETLLHACRGVGHIILTAGVRSGRFARESVVKATEYEGVLGTLAAAQAQGFTGRLVYMTSIGTTQRSLFASGLNAWKGNTLVWRRRAEEAIRASGLDYTVVRTAFLLNRPSGNHEICVTQGDRPLSLREVISRSDVAEALVALLLHPRASRATLEVSWCGRPRRKTWSELFANLERDQ